MATSKPGKFWTLVTTCLIIVIATGSIVIWTRYRSSQPIEIVTPPAPELPAEIYIGGAVSNPGYYPLKAGDNIEALIQAVGGTTNNADLTRLKLYVTEAGETEKPQKININSAELWLLEALPGIGETRAQAIIDYRYQNGTFHNTNELTKVAGIGNDTYEQIKHLVTVSD